jgi:signal transduction histidine kinase
VRGTVLRWLRRRTQAGALLAVLVLAGGVAVSAMAGMALHRAEESTAAHIMDRRVAAVQSLVAGEIRRYVDLAEGVAAAAGSQTDLTTTDFDAITAPLPHQRLSGVASVTLVVPVPTGGEAPVQEFWRARGAAGLVLAPAVNRPEHFYGIFSRSLTGPAHTGGIDAAQSPVLTTALEAARASGRTVISTPYQLLRDREIPASQRQPSFVVVVPVYEPGPVAGVRGRLRGWIGMSLHGQDFIGAALKQAAEGTLDAEVSTATADGTAETVASLRQIDRPADLVRETVVPVADRIWKLRVETARVLIPGGETQLDTGTLGGGMLLSALVAGLVLVLATGRQRAEARVRAATAELAAELAERQRTEKVVIALNTAHQTVNRELERRVQERTAQLESKAQALEQVNAELEAFSYSVSHDLRAPLRAINGFAGIVAEEYAEHLPPEGRRYLDKVSAGAVRMGQLIDGLLAFSRLQRHALEPQPVDLKVLVDEAWEELAPDRHARRVELIVGDLPPCEGDPRLLRHVVTNLLDNAVKYTRSEPVALIEVAADRVDGETVYRVRDNGAGFDMRYADKLFKVFQRLHREDEYEGTGVGLALVQRIVQRHGGRIWAEAAPGEGATFLFPLQEEGRS